eukprot:GHVS01081609.1.p1 GENE.GHVS01081609.1~~GHVS01081609.1.p1  ORF type:complete len:637 (+),score=113.00 GHVS01081609.1:274-2184(+)
MAPTQTTQTQTQTTPTPTLTLTTRTTPTLTTLTTTPTIANPSDFLCSPSFLVSPLLDTSPPRLYFLSLANRRSLILCSLFVLLLGPLLPPPFSTSSLPLLQHLLQNPDNTENITTCKHAMSRQISVHWQQQHSMVVVTDKHQQHPQYTKPLPSPVQPQHHYCTQRQEGRETHNNDIRGCIMLVRTEPPDQEDDKNGSSCSGVVVSSVVAWRKIFCLCFVLSPLISSFLSFCSYYDYYYDYYKLQHTLYNSSSFLLSAILFFYVSYFIKHNNLSPANRAVSSSSSILLLLIATAVYIAPKQAHGVCQQSMDFSPDRPRNRSGDLVACHEHSTRTCCHRRHTEIIARQLLSLHDLSSPCRSMTESVWCSSCDGDVGEGKFSESNIPRLCADFCDKWYQACRNDYFGPGPSGSGVAVTPCDEKSDVCSKLTDITENSQQFCYMSGYEVSNAPVAVMPCYSGVPSAVLYGPAPSPPSSAFQRHSSTTTSGRSGRSSSWNASYILNRWWRSVEDAPGWAWLLLALIAYWMLKFRQRFNGLAVWGRGGSQRHEVWHGPGYRLGGGAWPDEDRRELWVSSSTSDNRLPSDSVDGVAATTMPREMEAKFMIDRRVTESEEQKVGRTEGADDEVIPNPWDTRKII